MRLNEFIYNMMDKQLWMLYEISKKIISTDTHPEHIITEVVKLIGDIEKVQRVCFYVRSENGKIQLVSSIGVENTDFKINNSEGAVGFVFSKGYPIILNDLENNPIFLNKIRRTNLDKISFIAVPIKYHSQVVGVITLDIERDFPGVDNLIRFLTMISNLIGSYIHAYIQDKEKKYKLEYEIARLRKELAKNINLKEFVGSSKIYDFIIKEIYKVSNLDIDIMLRGESGTGKSTLAKIIHYMSNRKNGPFIEVNCAAIPSELFEAELFGYEKGAFTGAYSTKVGKIEAANKGTLFLDEIGELNLSLQAKLLRFLQTKEFERVGGTKTIKSDVRIVFATNRDLEKMVREGNFREDLYYRIATYIIYIPPLRERREDIPALIEYYAPHLSKVTGKNIKLSEDTLNYLLSCDFPGNVRELFNCLMKAAIHSEDGTIKPEDLSCVGAGSCNFQLLSIERKPDQKRQTNPEPAVFQEEKAETTGENINIATGSISYKDKFVEEEIKMIIQALEKTGYVQAKAARLLGISLRQLNYRIKKYNIPIKKL